MAPTGEREPEAFVPPVASNLLVAPSVPVAPTSSPIAAVIAECMSAPVEATVRAANVEALNSCSA